MLLMKPEMMRRVHHLFLRADPHFTVSCQSSGGIISAGVQFLFLGCLLMNADCDHRAGTEESWTKCEDGENVTLLCFFLKT